MQFLATVGLSMLAWLALALAALRCVEVCRSGELLVLLGRAHTLPDGSRAAYRLVAQGLALRLPLLEHAARLSLRAVPLRCALADLRTGEGGDARLTLELAATARLLPAPAAVERFLGQPPEAVGALAAELLGPRARALVAERTLEQLGDRQALAAALREAARPELLAAGIELLTLDLSSLLRGGP